MKNLKVPISLYVLIPLIFSGIALISSVVSHSLTAHYMERSGDAAPYIFWWSVFVVILTTVTSSIIISLVLRPIVNFLNESRKLAVLSIPEAKSRHEAQTDPVYYKVVFDKLTDILSKVEARELFPEIVGQSLVMRNLFTQMLKVAPTDTTVLIMGESGTGKELIANALCEHSRRKGKPFVKLNCAAIPEGLLESELFGHERGSFTGAIAQKKGKFELADGGTIFLDEIGDMPLATQAKVLRTLQEKEFNRVGGSHTIKVDTRFMAATNKDLEGLVKQGEFREDLYFRLNVFPIHVPPLRERREDIPLLCHHFLQAMSADAEISPEALQILIGHIWSGNVRELQNVMERAVVLAGKGARIEGLHLPVTVRRNFNSVSDKAALDNLSLDLRLANTEKSLIIEALVRTGCVQARAAELLGVNQRSLWHRIKKLGIEVSSLKNQNYPFPKDTEG